MKISSLRTFLPGCRRALVVLTTFVSMTSVLMSCDTLSVEQLSEAQQNSIVAWAGPAATFCGHFRKMKDGFDSVSEQMTCDSLQSDYLENSDQHYDDLDKDTCCECFFPGTICPQGQVLRRMSRCQMINEDFRRQFEEALRHRVSTLDCPQPQINDIATCCENQPDFCPDDPDKADPGACGCGIRDVDGDGDGTSDCQDVCPYDPHKADPGECGCGIAEVDGDGDGTFDCQDGCPYDSDKTDPGECGCGALDVDGDGDGTYDCQDACPDDSEKTEPGICGCGASDVDGDGDGTFDCEDACPDDPEKTDPGERGCGSSEMYRLISFDTFKPHRQ